VPDGWSLGDRVLGAGVGDWLGVAMSGDWPPDEEPPLLGVLASVPADPVSVGVSVGDGLVLGLLVGGGVVTVAEGAVLDADGCGAVGDDAGVGCCVADEDGDGVEVAVAPDGAQDGTGADSSAIVGVFGSATPGAGAVEPIMAACASGPAACVPLVAVGGESDADWHCGPLLTLVGATECAGAGVLEAVEVPGPEPPGPAAGFGAGVPWPSVLVPSTLAACPPVSTLELTCTTACRSGATASVAQTARAIPPSTAAGRNQPRSPAARSTARSAGDSSGRRGRGSDLSPPGKGHAGLSPRGKVTAGHAQ
jgi:hypothetical protein